ncbi:MAG: guanylate kinase [Candidatus Melainabacteria bacterium]|jgi:guanylate kinase|nr:guanylate kinase [Candidatus Melainabacteria bacterium]
MNSKMGNLIVFTGPSGVGKGTVVKQLFQNLDNLIFSVSVTTREKRSGEEEGKNYFFRTNREFDELIQADKLLEWAEFVGNKYGTPKDFVFEKLKNGTDVFLEIEVQGALQVKEKFPEALMIFLLPPSIDELEARLRKRATEPEEKILLRLAKARDEMKYINDFDFSVINDSAERAGKELREIILNRRIEKKNLFNDYKRPTPNVQFQG